MSHFNHKTTPQRDKETMRNKAEFAFSPYQLPQRGLLPGRHPGLVTRVHVRVVLGLAGMMRLLVIAMIVVVPRRRRGRVVPGGVLVLRGNHLVLGRLLLWRLRRQHLGPVDGPLAPVLRGRCRVEVIVMGSPGQHRRSHVLLSTTVEGVLLVAGLVLPVRYQAHVSL